MSTHPHSPAHDLRRDGTVARRHAASIVGNVSPLRMTPTELPYVKGSADTTVTYGECADVGAFGVILNDKVSVKRDIAEPFTVTSRRMARVTDLDHYADVWMRQQGADDFPAVIGSEYVSAHGMIQVDDIDARGQIPAWRNSTIADDARARCASPEDFKALDAHYAYPCHADVPGAHQTRLTWFPRKLRKPATNVLARHATRLQLQQDKAGWYRQVGEVKHYVSASTRQGYIRVEHDEPIAVRARKARTMIEASRSQAALTEQRSAELAAMAPGAKVEIAGISITRQANDGRWNIQGTRYRTPSAAAHALTR